MFNKTSFVLLLQGLQMFLYLVTVYFQVILYHFMYGIHTFHTCALITLLLTFNVIVVIHFISSYKPHNIQLFFVLHDIFFLNMVKNKKEKCLFTQNSFFCVELYFYLISFSSHMLDFPQNSYFLQCRYSGGEFFHLWYV